MRKKMKKEVPLNKTQWEEAPQQQWRGRKEEGKKELEALVNAFLHCSTKANISEEGIEPLCVSISTKGSAKQEEKALWLQMCYYN